MMIDVTCQIVNQHDSVIFDQSKGESQPNRQFLFIQMPVGV